MNIIYCRSVLIVTLLAVLLSFTSSTPRRNSSIAGNSDAPSQSHDNDITDDGGNYVQFKPMWELLEMTNGMGGVLPSEQRIIKCVKITFIARNADHWKVGFVGHKPLVYETDNPHEMKVITVFLTHPFRLAASERSHGCFGSGFNVGTIEVTTNKDKFSITITRIGFMIGDSPDIHTIFYSWGLAHYLDDLCVQKVGVHIPADIMEHLTGEQKINTEKKILEELNEQRRKDIEREN